MVRRSYPANQQRSVGPVQCWMGRHGWHNLIYNGSLEGAASYSFPNPGSPLCRDGRVGVSKALAYSSVDPVNFQGVQSTFMGLYNISSWLCAPTVAELAGTDSLWLVQPTSILCVFLVGAITLWSSAACLFKLVLWLQGGRSSTGTLFLHWWENGHHKNSKLLQCEHIVGQLGLLREKMSLVSLWPLFFHGYPLEYPETVLHIILTAHIGEEVLWILVGAREGGSSD